MRVRYCGFLWFCLIVLGLAVVLSCGDDDDQDDDCTPCDDDDASDDDDAADDDDDNNDDSVWPAELPGPYYAGAVPIGFSDPDRSRKLPGYLWYPTEQTSGASMTYMFGLIWDDDAIRDAKLASGGPFPLIVFSHGISSVDFQSFALMDYLASHGYVVASASHLQSTLFTYVGTEFFSKSAIDRPQDVSALIDAMLRRNNTPGDPLFEKIDPDRIGVVGHSFGGYTAIASLNPPLDVYGMIEKCEQVGQANWSGEWKYCHDVTTSDLSFAEDCRPCSLGDARIKAAVPMSPAFPYIMVPGALASVDVPALVMVGELDEVTPPDTQVRVYFDGLSHPETLYWELAGGSHDTFSSACEMSIVRAIFDCGDGFIDPKIAFVLIRTATVAFFGLHLKGQEPYRSYFEQPYLSTVPEVTLETK